MILGWGVSEVIYVGYSWLVCLFLVVAVCSAVCLSCVVFSSSLSFCYLLVLVFLLLDVFNICCVVWLDCFIGHMFVLMFYGFGGYICWCVGIWLRNCVPWFCFVGGFVCSYLLLFVFGCGYFSFLFGDVRCFFLYLYLRLM